MKSRLYVSNYDIDVFGGAEFLGRNFAKALNLAYASSSTFGITPRDNIWITAALIDERLGNIEHIDILLRNSINGWSWSFGLNKKPNINKDVVVCHEHFKDEAISLKDDALPLFEWKYYIDWPKQLKSVSNSDIVVVVSEREKRLWERDVENKPIKVIEPCINSQNFIHIEKSEAKKRLGISPSKKVILTVGRNHIRKGADIIFYLIEKMPDCFFINIGYNPSEGQNYISGSGLSNNDLNLCFMASDLFVLPSRYESFGIVFAEALYCNLPIVSAEVGLMADSSLHKYGIILKKVNKNEFEEAVRQALGTKFPDSHEMAKERFSFHRFKNDCQTKLN